MPVERARLDGSGIHIAAPGHGVDEPEAYQYFSPRGIPLPIALKGAVAVPSGTVNTGAPEPFNNVYRRVTVPFGRTFPYPPIVLIMGVGNSGYAQPPTYALVASFSGPLRYGFEPAYFVEVTTSSMNLWCRFSPSSVPSLSYIVLEVTLS